MHFPHFKFLSLLQVTTLCIVKSCLREERTNNESQFIDQLTSGLAHSNEEYTEVIENQLDSSNVVGYQISKYQEISFIHLNRSIGYFH